MKIRAVEYDDGELPVALTVHMTVTEAAIIVTIMGRTSAKDREALMTGGGDAGSDVYDCLSGGLFNRHWEAGVAGYVRGEPA